MDSSSITVKFNEIIDQFQLTGVFEVLKYDAANWNSILANLSFSGSFVMELIRNRKNLDSMPMMNDLDIYIDITKTNEVKIEQFLDLLTSSGFVGKPRHINLDTDDKTLYQSNRRFARRAIDVTASIGRQWSHNPDYFSLKDYINMIMGMVHKESNVKLDLIFMNRPIKDILFETFDFDVVKNYAVYDIENDMWNVNAFNCKAIDSGVATMTKSHLSNRVLSNAFEFHNFIYRCHKYSVDKKFTVMVDVLEITPELLDMIIVNYMSYTNIDDLSKHTYRSYYTSAQSKIKPLNENSLELIKEYDYCIRSIPRIIEASLLFRFNKHNVSEKMSMFLFEKIDSINSAPAEFEKIN